MDSSMKLLYEEFDVYLINDITQLIHSDDLYNLSNCNVLLNEIVHDRSFIQKKMYSIHHNMKGLIVKKKWYGIFYHMVRNGHLEMCKHIVLLKIFHTIHLNELLNCAAYRGHLKICKYLVYLGATDFKHAIDYAIKGANLDICKYLASFGTININWALYYTAHRGHLDICKYFVSIGATDFDKALYYAARKGNLDICNYLVSLSSNLLESCT